MFEILLVFLGGSIGAVLRYTISLFYHQSCWGTLLINVVGCLLIGFISYFAIKNKNFMTSNLKLFLTTGIVGGFTTFSTFSYDIFNLIQNGEIHGAAIYLFLTYLLGLGAVFVGFLLAKICLHFQQEEIAHMDEPLDENELEDDYV